jgi:hypothetical protein
VGEYNPQGIAWAAGLFEGEGCLNVYRRARRGKTSGMTGSVQINLGTTDLDVVERFAQIVGVGAICRDIKPVRPEWKPMHKWSAYGFEKVQYVVAMFWPWLGERRRAKAREVLLAARYVQRKGDRQSCPNGHSYAGDNLMLEPIQRGDQHYFARRCKECRTVQARERARRRLGITPDRYRV